MKPPKSRKAELGSNATGGEKSHAETAESAEFKMTELGPIPVDWEVKRIIDVAPLQRGFDLPFSHLMEGVVPVVYSNGIGAYHSKGMCKGPGLVTGRSGTIGKFFYIESGDYWPHNTTLWVTDFCGNNPLFVKYLYETLDFEDFSTGTGVPTLNRNSVHEHKVVIPPLAEQRRIARALSDVDELILALGKLIEKKRNIKTGAMQELLTGKTRLPGFGNPETQSLCASVLKKDTEFEDLDFNTETQRHEVTEFKMTELGPIPKDWEVKRLGNVANILDNRRVPLSESQRKSGAFPYCGANGIVDYIDRYEFDEEAVLIAEDGGNFADFATRPIAYKMSGKYWVNNHAHVLTVKACCDLDYLFSYLSHKDITDIISGGTRAKLTRAQLENIIISLPPLAEQKAIAAVLSDIDAEIAALEADRGKYERIKSGMMQELLTGKTRLKP